MHTIAVIRFSSMSRIQPSSRKISGSVSSWRHDAIQAGRVDAKRNSDRITNLGFRTPHFHWSLMQVPPRGRMKWSVRLMRKAGRRIPRKTLINETGLICTIPMHSCTYGHQEPYTAVEC